MWLAGLLIPLMGFLLLSSPSGHAQATSGTATFTYSPAQPDINTLVTLDASASSSPNGAITIYEWDFNGDGQFDLSTSNPSVTHLFDHSGAVSVTLRVTDARGNSFSATQTIQVADAPVLVRRAIATPVAPNRVAAGSSFQVTVTIQTDETVNGLGLEEDPPQGWPVGLVDGAGAVFKSSNAQFLWLETLNPGTTLRVVYNVTVPTGTAPGLYNLAGRVSSFAPRFKIELVGDTQVQVF
jgi:PKD repeat protein